MQKYNPSNKHINFTVKKNLSQNWHTNLTPNKNQRNKNCTNNAKVKKEIPYFAQKNFNGVLLKKNFDDGITSKTCYGLK